MVGRNVRIGLDGEHGEGLSIRIGKPEASNAEPWLVSQPKRPLRLPGALKRVWRGRGELVEGLRRDQAPAAGEAPAFAAEVEHRLAGWSGPAPAELHQLSATVSGAAYDQSHVADPHVIARLQVRQSGRKAQRNTYLAKGRCDLVGAEPERVVVADVDGPPIVRIIADF